MHSRSIVSASSSFCLPLLAAPCEQREDPVFLCEFKRIVDRISGVDVATRAPSDNLTKRHLPLPSLLAGISFKELSESNGMVFAHKPLLLIPKDVGKCLSSEIHYRYHTVLSCGWTGIT